jgi:hypothetical protein
MGAHPSSSPMARVIATPSVWIRIQYLLLVQQTAFSQQLRVHTPELFYTICCARNVLTDRSVAWYRERECRCSKHLVDSLSNEPAEVRTRPTNEWHMHESQVMTIPELVRHPEISSSSQKFQNNRGQWTRWREVPCNGSNAPRVPP